MSIPLGVVAFGKCGLKARKYNVFVHRGERRNRNAAEVRRSKRAIAVRQTVATNGPSGASESAL
jgi:hypothetical protein